jgi:hypothetical protein
MRTKRRLWTALALGAAVAATVAASAPALVRAADHADAPGNLVSPSGRRDADINDVYAFPASDGPRTVFAVTTHPAVGVLSPAAYGTDVEYALNLDTDGDAVADIRYVVRFDAMKRDGTQRFTVKRVEHGRARTLGTGRTGRTNDLRGDVLAFAGVRSDPFFFDLDAFKHVVAGDPSRSFCDTATSDFFAPLNTNAIVLEIPNAALPAHVGIWANTTVDGVQIDRMGRPAINTVFNQGDDKNGFNAIPPSEDRTAFEGTFPFNVRNVLAKFSSLDAEGAYSPEVQQALADVLLPDVLPYDIGTPTVGAFNGRALTDDVIDTELNIVTGGFPVDGVRDAMGAVPTDCVGAHGDYQASFPYLGQPH